MQGGPSKNMDRMAEVVPESKSRNLQQFLTHSKWNHRDVIDHVAQDADGLLGGPSACLLIDESGFAKQGKESVGVSRQWLGRFGKVDNGQVAVFGALSDGFYVAPVDVRLYLPQKWTDDPERCERSGIPDEEQIFRTKIDLAEEIVQHARDNGLHYGWVGADAGYGKGPGFCLTLDVMDDNSDIKISLSNAPKGTTLKRLGWMQRQRFWIERTFEDAKSECGMADYQVRKWRAWHHHMALVMMAMLFMLSERISHEETYPLLSCADIENLLAHFLPRRDVTEEEVIFQLEERHRQRQKAIESHARCQAKRAEEG